MIHEINIATYAFYKRGVGLEDKNPLIGYNEFHVKASTAYRGDRLVTIHKHYILR